ncbi:MAG TPA: hypothetical protein VK821_02610 [Dehalococcoidia bacterium]|nr:hypothetical protein [Dehalococcoidia bacterium]
MSDVPLRAGRAPRKNLKLAVLLQCIPLLGAGTCLARAASNQGTGYWIFLWFSVCLWGVGYFYLGRIRRGLLLFLLGPVLAFTSCFASNHGVDYDYEHCYPGRVNPCPAGDANRASVETGLIVGAAVLIVAVDTWRLAERQNR